MKKKILVPVIIVLFIIVCTSTVLYANTSQEKINFSKILNKEEIDFEQNAYIESKAKINELSSNYIIEKSNNILLKVGIKDKNINMNNSEISQYRNEIDSRNETVISNEDFLITLNSDNGELISFTSDEISFEDNKLSKDEIKNIALDIFENLDIKDSQQYELSYVTEFDEEIWRAGFVKKYNDLVNEGECVKFSFAPQTKEVVTLAINNIEYANNDILISKVEAEKIANEYLSKSKADKMSMEIKIVRPNYLYENKLGYGKVYKKINQARKAYVFTFNNESNSKVYVDCTTGEVLGGDIIMGGEF